MISLQVVSDSCKLAFRKWLRRAERPGVGLPACLPAFGLVSPLFVMELWRRYGLLKVPHTETGEPSW